MTFLEWNGAVRCGGVVTVWTGVGGVSFSLEEKVPEHEDHNIVVPESAPDQESAAPINPRETHSSNFRLLPVLFIMICVGAIFCRKRIDVAKQVHETMLL